jgi:hypothetical protein
MAKTTHEQDIAWLCVQDAMKVLGTGWNHVSDDVRWGLVASEILSVVVGQSALTDDEYATDKRLGGVALYTRELWRVGMAIKDNGWKRPWAVKAVKS